MKKIDFLTKLICLALLGCLLGMPTKSWAQQYDIGGGLGLAAYSGDIVRRLDRGNVGLHGTLFGRRNFDNVWSLRAGFSYGRISAADSISRIDAAALMRDAAFRGNIYEVSAVMEYHFLDFKHPQRSMNYSPYGFFGLGYSLFSGQGRTYVPTFIGNPSDPEAVVEDYTVATPVIPFGLGIKFKLSKQWLLGVEMGFRATFSDALDKIDREDLVISRFQGPPANGRQRGFKTGNYSDRDWYYFLGVHLSYSIGTVKCFAY